MIIKYQSVLKTYVFTVIAYIVALIANYEGYGPFIFIVIVLTVALALHFTMKHQSLWGRALFSILFIVLCGLLNYLYAILVKPRPKSEFGFAMFWFIMQAGMFVAMVVLGSLSERIKKRKEN